MPLSKNTVCCPPSVLPYSHYNRPFLPPPRNPSFLFAPSSCNLSEPSCLNSSLINFMVCYFNPFFFQCQQLHLCIFLSYRAKSNFESLHHSIFMYLCLGCSAILIRKKKHPTILQINALQSDRYL